MYTMKRTQKENNQEYFVLTEKEKPIHNSNFCTVATALQSV